MKAINLTPHAIVIRVDGKDLTIPPSGKVARVAVVSADRGSVDIDGMQVPVVANKYGQVEGLPSYEDEPDAVCIVSALVLGRCVGAAGVYAPDTGPTAVRDEKGLIKAVTRLISAE